jgi:RHS repeat-associated protein
MGFTLKSEAEEIEIYNNKAGRPKKAGYPMSSRYKQQQQNRPSPSTSTPNEPFRYFMVFAFLVNILMAMIPPGSLAAAALPLPEPDAAVSTFTPANQNQKDKDKDKDPQSLAAKKAAKALATNSPLNFEANIGQSAANVKYLARGRGYSIFFTDQPGATLNLRKLIGKEVEPPSSNTKKQSQSQAQSTPQAERNLSAKGLAIRMALVGASANTNVTTEEPLAGKINYLVGTDANAWRIGVSSYGQIAYTNVYSNIDLKFYGNQNQLEYDLIVRPGGDVNQIAVRYEGVDKLDLTAKGELELGGAGGNGNGNADNEKLVQPAPVIYQIIGGSRVNVTGEYVLRGTGIGNNREVGFRITGGYNRDYPLVIDPLLSYSTYLGGDYADDGPDMVLDASGNAYLTGFTAGSDFPVTTGAYSTTYGGGSLDAFVTKLSANGGSLIYSTFIGGNGADYGRDIAVDSQGQVHFTGFTASTNFPTTAGARQTSYGGGANDAFVVKLNAAGSALVYSSYLGGTGDDKGFSVGVRATDGHIFVYGQTVLITATNNFPTTSGAYRTTPIGSDDTFVARLNPVGGGASDLVYSTYYGGIGFDIPTDLAVDGSGNAYFTGYTTSITLPTMTGAFQTTYGGGDQDAFVAKLNSTGTGLGYSTFLGGSGSETGHDLVVAASDGSVYLVGDTSSTNFGTTTGAVQTALAGSEDVFVVRFNAAGSARLYSTYLGGSGSDKGFGIALDGQGNVYLSGITASSSPTNSNFPTTPGAFQTVYGGGSADAFFSLLAASTGTTYTLGYSSYLGGSGHDFARDIAVDSVGNPYLNGGTASADFPVTSGAYQTEPGGSTDIFLTKFALTRLEFTTQPGNAYTNANLSPQPVVSALRYDGTTFTSFSGAITINLTPATSTLTGAELGGTKVVTAVNGVASFSGSGLNVSRAGNGYRLVAALNGSNLLAEVESAPFNITPDPNLRELTILAGNAQSTLVGTAFPTPLVVRVKTLGGSVVPNLPVTFQAAVATNGTNPTGSFSGSAVSVTLNTDMNGIVTATTFTANANAGSYYVTASAAQINNNARFLLSNVLTQSVRYDYAIALEPIAAGPLPLSSTMVLTATLKRHGVVTVTDVPLSLNITSRDQLAAPSVTSNRNAAGQMVYTYTRTLTSTDDLVVSATVNGQTLYSNPATLYWLKPAFPVGLDSVNGIFYEAKEYIRSIPNPVYFADYLTQTPLISKTFASLIFNPYTVGDVPNVPVIGSEVNDYTEPFANVLVNAQGVATGYIETQDNRVSVGTTTTSPIKPKKYKPFATMLTGNFVVDAPMTATFNIWHDDNLVIGVGANAAGKFATRVHDDNGADTNPYDNLYIYENSNCLIPGGYSIAEPPTNVLPPTAKLKLPPVVARNCNWYGGYRGNGEEGYTIAYTFTLSFPEPGVYPYEIDFYQQGGAQYLAIPQVTANSQSFKLIGTQALLKLEPGGSATATQTTGITQTHTVTATLTTPTGLPFGQGISVSLSIAGANSQHGAYPVLLTAPTDAQGRATFTYTGTNAGMDYLSASAWISGTPTLSNQVTKTWSLPATGSGSGGGGGGGTPEINCNVNYNWLSYPTQGAQLSTQTAITLASGINFPNGTGLPAGTVVQVYPVSTPSYSSMITLTASGGVGPVSGGNAIPGVMLDPTKLANGAYVLRVAYTDTSVTPNQCHSNLTLINVVGENKPGRVAFDVTDFTVPVAGMPIVVGRTYDSLERGRSGDFGHGWNLSISSPKLEVNPAGDVTLTLLDGKRVTFFFTPNFILFAGIAGYTGEAGVYGSLTSSGCQLVVSAGGAGGYTCFPGPRYDPDGYTYRDPYGRIYNIERTAKTEPFKLTSLTDLNGNTLKFADDGIRASNLTGDLNGGSKIVSFERDSEKRITKITDPAGKDYNYYYASSTTSDPTIGDLVKVEFPESMPGVTPAQPISTTYTYYTAATGEGFAHFFKEVKDPRGNRAAKTEYYTTTTGADSGRLKNVTDALGEVYSYTYSFNAADGTNTTFVTNPDGGVSASKANSYGKVISTSTDIRTTSADAPRWRITQSGYDANRNQITQTLPIARADGSGPRTITYTYDIRGNREKVYSPHAAAIPTPTVTTYGPYGGPLSITDPTGRAVAVGYDENFMPTEVNDGRGYVGGYTFDVRGSILSRKDGNGKETSFEYDQFGNKKKETDSLGNSTNYEYDTLGRVITATDALGVRSVNRYDALGRVAQTTVAYGTPVSATTSYEYDANGNQKAVVDPLGRRTEYLYDAANRVIETKYADNTTVRQRYDWRGGVISTTDQLGRTTLSRYDLAGQLISTTVAAGTSDAATTVHEYDDAGRKVREYNPYSSGGSLPANQKYTRSEYDDADRLITSTNQLGHSTVFTYDGANRKIAERDALGRVTSYEYDTRGQLQKTLQPPLTGGVVLSTTQNYDLAGRVLTRTDAAGIATLYDYYDNGWLRQVSIPITQAQGNYARTSYQYDKLGRLRFIQDANLHSTEFTYDEQGRQSQKIWPDRSFEEWKYDLTGNMTRHRLADGNANLYDYDSLNRLKTTNYFDGKSVVFTYTLVGQRQAVQDWRGLTQYNYDNRDRVKSVIQPGGKQSVSYSYDERSLRSSITSIVTNTSNVASSNAVSYTYDENSRLTGVNAPSHGGQTIFTYTNTGLRQGSLLPNGVATNYSYDALNRLTGIHHYKNSVFNTLAQYTYTLSASGNRTSISEYEVQAGGGSVTRNNNWGYDDAYRLVTETRQVTNTSAATTLYSYDKVGNRLAMKVGSSPLVSYNYNELDQLTSVISNGMTTQYSYDRRGNLKQVGNGTDATNYNWNAADRLAEILLPNNTNAIYTYDFSGRRVQAVVTQGLNISNTTFLWDETSHYGDVLSEIDVTTGNEQLNYVMAVCKCSSGGQLLSQSRNNTYNYFLVDGQYSTRILVNNTANVLANYTYSAYGTLTNGQNSTLETRYLYTGQQFDKFTDQYYLRARYYSPDNGLFLTRDVITINTRNPVEWNRYKYVAGNPVNYIDPSGNYLDENGFIQNYVSLKAKESVVVVARVGVAQKLATLILSAIAIGIFLTSSDEDDGGAKKPPTTSYNPCDEYGYNPTGYINRRFTADNNPPVSFGSTAKITAKHEGLIMSYAGGVRVGSRLKLKNIVISKDGGDGKISLPDANNAVKKWYAEMKLCGIDEIEFDSYNVNSNLGLISAVPGGSVIPL